VKEEQEEEEEDKEEKFDEDAIGQRFVQNFFEPYLD
jgi:hypothetical protein